MFDFQYKCAGSGKCIPLVHVCDGDRDCEDGSDEQKCDSNTCAPNHIRCGSGRCILQTWVCDGEKDCPSGEDEPASCTQRTCDPTYFKCANNK